MKRHRFSPSSKNDHLKMKKWKLVEIFLNLLLDDYHDHNR